MLVAPRFPQTLLAALLLMVAVSFAYAQPNANDLSAWKITGGLSADASRPGPNGGTSWKLEPGARAELPLRSEAGAGEVSFWVYDDGTDSAGKSRHIGPQWGVTQPDGRTLAIGICYAPYLAANGSFAASDYKSNFFEALQYMGSRKADKWTKWTITFDPNEGALINIDGKNRKFDWNKGKIAGFSGLVLIGDSEGSAKPQTIWVSDIEYKLGGKMAVAPTPPPPPPPVVPEKDPVAEGPVPTIRPEVKDVHPRLLFVEEDLPRMREVYNSEDGAIWRERMERYLPASRAVSEDNKFLKDATDGQRQGFWRLPTVAMDYLMTGDEQSRDQAIAYLELFNSLPDWEQGKERNSGMSSANIMVGAALAYDWLYNDLDPAFREEFRQKLFQMARAQYYGGHLKGNPGPHYWQSDPANNHRWMRNAGMMTALLASYNGDPEQDWLLQQAAEEVAFTAEHLPADGTSHEGSGYIVFGSDHLAVLMSASDNVLGTDYLDNPFFYNVLNFRFNASTSDKKNVLRFGDQAVKPGGTYGNVFTLAAARSGDPVQKAKARDIVDNVPDLLSFPWLSIIWDDPDLIAAENPDYETAVLFPDVATAYIRDQWGEDGVSALFKCGPFGGYALNKFRDEANGYINVAHDDPDANSFLLARGGVLLVETDGYSKHKASSNHNTILINGMGQMSQGRKEGVQWSQPSTGGSMMDMAYLTAWQATPGLIAIEGEAAGSYLQTGKKKKGASRPALDRYRRTLLWVEGDYVLVLDDIDAPEDVEITWLIQSKAVTTGADGRFTLEADGEVCAAQLVSDVKFESKVADSTADHRGKVLGLRQLQATADTAAARFASVYNIWNGDEITVTLKPNGDKDATVIVESKSFKDEWTWKAAEGAKTPSLLTGKRLKGEAVDGLPMTLEGYQVDVADLAPIKRGGN